MNYDFDLLESSYEAMYPTEEFLQVIKNDWKIEDIKEQVDLLKKVWYYEDYVRLRKEEDGDYILTLITGGWSGNESIVEALMNNKNMWWRIFWNSSERGGRYNFIIPKKWMED